MASHQPGGQTWAMPFEFGADEAVTLMEPLSLSVPRSLHPRSGSIGKGWPPRLP